MSTTSQKAAGRDLLDAEMARQHSDAARSIEANGEMARRVAASLAKTRSLLMLGMGASHYANRIVEPLYRSLGIESWAATAADFIEAPLPVLARTALIVSQSGESGEVARLVELTAGADAFGMTLDPESRLGRSLPCLVGAGGGEIAFAATRSLFVTLALHARLLSAISGDMGMTAIPQPASPALDSALAALATCPTIAVSGHGALRGMSEAAALMLMELGRLAALGFEIAQFRHGPLELLSPDVGVVLLRDAGGDEASLHDVAQAALGAGGPLVVFDCSGKPPIDGATTLPFPAERKLAAVFAMLPTLQRLVIEIAARRVERVGEPVRSTKITRAAS